MKEISQRILDLIKDFQSGKFDPKDNSKAIRREDLTPSLSTLYDHLVQDIGEILENVEIECDRCGKKLEIPL